MQSAVWQCSGLKCGRGQYFTTYLSCEAREPSHLLRCILCNNLFAGPEDLFDAHCITVHASSNLLDEHCVTLRLQGVVGV